MWSFLWPVLSGAFVAAAVLATLGLVTRLIPRFRCPLDRAGERLGTAVIVLATVLASAMLALSFVTAQLADTDARACLLARLQDRDLFSVATDVSWASLYGCLVGLAFAFAQSVTSPDPPTMHRRWLTASVLWSTSVSLLFFPWFVTWMLSAADCAS